MPTRAHLSIAIVGLAALAASAATARAGTFRREELVVDGVTRELFVYTPDKLPPGHNPVVLAFHGFQSDASGLRWLAKIDGYADAAGLIVIYPNAVDKSWNAGRGSGSTNRTTDDAAFAKALLAATAARPEVDPKRIYAMGFSNGAQMVATIVCTLDNQLAAAAMVSHSLNIPNCEPRARVPMLLIQGRADPFVPFEGGGKSELTSHAFTVDYFRKINLAAGPAKKVFERESIHCTESDDAAGREQVLECIGERDGHTWPGAVVFQPELFGPTNSELVGTEYVFSFFSRHTQPAPRRTAPAASAPVTIARAPAAPPPAAPPPEQKKPEPSRWSERTVTLSPDTKRRYYEPREGLASARSLVLVFPDGAAQPDAVAAALGVARMPSSLGFVIMDLDSNAVAPVVDQLRERLGAPLPVSVVGIGVGGAVAQRLFCERPDLVSAVVMIAAGFKRPPCEPLPVPSLLSVQAARDTRAPADGDPKQGLMSQAELRANWRSNFGSSLDSSAPSGAGYACQVEGQRDEPEIRTCRTESSEHGVPSGSFDAAKHIGEFLVRHQGAPVIFTVVHAH
jgi:polyhydroxybutyrate depolymerase